MTVKETTNQLARFTRPVSPRAIIAGESEYFTSGLNARVHDGFHHVVPHGLYVEDQYLLPSADVPESVRPHDVTTMTTHRPSELNTTPDNLGGIIK